MTFDGTLTTGLTAPTDQPILSAWHPCGTPGCRVCKALTSAYAPRSRTIVRRGSHHPLNTPRALARIGEIHTAMLEFQSEHSRPGLLAELAALTGVKSHGLLSLYMQRMLVMGLVRLLRVRGRNRWEAVR